MTARQQQLSEWAWSWRPWWDEVTAQMRRAMPYDNQDPALIDPSPFHHWYLGRDGDAPRNRGLAIIDQGIRLGVPALTEYTRRRFHNPTPVELWKLVSSCWIAYLEPHLRTDDGAAVPQ